MRHELSAKALTAAITALMLISLISVFQAGAVGANGVAPTIDVWKGIGDGVNVGFAKDDDFLYLSFVVEEEEETFLLVFMDTKEGGRPDGSDYMIVDPLAVSYAYGEDWYLGKWQTVEEQEALGAENPAPGWSEPYDYALGFDRLWKAWDCEGFEAEEGRNEHTHYNFKIPLDGIEFNPRYGLNLLVHTDAGLSDWVRLAPGSVVNEETGVTYDTIQLAIDAAPPGDTVLVYPGTYAESVTVDVEGVTIKGENLDAIVDGGFVLKADNITIDGLTIRNGGFGAKPRGIFTRAATGPTWGSKGHRIVNNDIIGLGGEIGYAINIVTCAEEPVNIVVDNNKIHDWKIAIMLEGYDTTIINNEIYNNSKSGIDVERSCNNEIGHNDIYNNGECGIYIGKVDTTGNAINYNNIENNPLGINNASTSTIDATYNWWGTTDMIFIANSVEGKVYVEPWLDDTYPDGKPIQFLTAADLEEQIAALKSEINALNDQVEDLRAANTKLAELLDSATAGLTADIAELQTMVENQASEIEGLTESIANLVTDIEGRLEELGITDEEIWDALDNLRSDLEDIELKPGPQGPEGSEGPAGDTGSAGEQGEQGEPAPTEVVWASIAIAIIALIIAFVAIARES